MKITKALANSCAIHSYSFLSEPIINYSTKKATICMLLTHLSKTRTEEIKCNTKGSSVEREEI